MSDVRMSKFVEKKWYRGTLDSCFSEVKGGLNQVGGWTVCKCLLLAASASTSVDYCSSKVLLIDSDGLILLRHLRGGLVKVLGRRIDTSPTFLQQYRCDFCLEVEQIIVVESSTSDADLPCKVISLRGGDMAATMAGKLLSLGPPLNSISMQHEAHRQSDDSFVPAIETLTAMLEVEFYDKFDSSGIGIPGPRGFVVLHGHATTLCAYLHVQQFYFFPITAESRVDIQCISTGDTIHVFPVNNQCGVQECPASVTANDNVSRVLLHTERIVRHHQSFLRPQSVVLRDTLMYTELDIQGELLHTYKLSSFSNGLVSEAKSNVMGTWLELAGNLLPGGTRGDKFLLYIYPHPAVAPAGFFSQILSFRRGATVIVRNVLPIYLWGRLHGFAATIRSQIALTRFSPLVGDTLLNCPTALSLNCDIKCLQFTAWRAYCKRRLNQAFPPGRSQSIINFWEEGIARSVDASFFNVALGAYHPKIFQRVLKNASQHLEVENISINSFPVMEPIYDKNVAELTLVRAGMDGDYLCSQLPELWTTSMLRQFGENMMVHHVRKEKKKRKRQLEIESSSKHPSSSSLPREKESLEKLFTSLVSTAQSSPLRFETFDCPHDVILVGVASAVLCPPPCCGTGTDGDGLWCVSMADHCGQALLVLIASNPLTPSTAHTLLSPTCQCQSSSSCASDCFKTVFRQWVRQSKPKIAMGTLCVTVVNPTVLVEMNPRHNEQNAQVIVAVQGTNIRAYWESATMGVDVKTKEESASILKHSVAVSKFVSTHLLQSNLMESALRIVPEAYKEWKDDLFRPVIGVREALMMDPFTGPILVPCLRAIVVRKEYTSDMGYYNVRDTSTISQNSGQVKYHKFSIRKCVVHLRDLEFGDIIYLYLPETPTAAAICMQNLIVNIFYCQLQLSANSRHTYLEYDINKSCIGVASAEMIFKHLAVSTNDTKSNESYSRSIDQTDDARSPFPRCNLYSFYQNHYRNRCAWNIVGQFILAKEINIFMRCNSCQCKGSVTYAPVVTYKCTGNGKRCDNEPSQSPSKFHIWWHGVLVFDDGSGEVHICLESVHLLWVLRVLYERSGGLTTHGSEKQSGASFSSFQNSIESHVVSTFSAVSYSFASVSMTRGYSSMRDSEHGVCSDDMQLLAASSHHVLQDKAGGDRSIRSNQSVYNDFYDNNNPANLVHQRYVDKIKQVQAIDSFLQSCSFACCSFEVCVKIIFSNMQSRSKHSDGSDSLLKNALRRALGRIDVSAGSIASGGYSQTRIRRVKVQCANVPPWVVENVELPSEAIGTVKLQCLHVTGGEIGSAACVGNTRNIPTNETNTAHQAWNMLKELDTKA